MHPRCNPLLKGSLNDRLVKSHIRWGGIIFSLGVILTHGSPFNQTLDFSNGACQLEARFFDGRPNLIHSAREFFSQYFTTKSEINLDVLILKSTSPLQFEVQATGIATLDVKDIIAWVRPGVFIGNADYSITISRHTYLRFKSNQLIPSFSRTSSSKFHGGNHRAQLRRNGWRR
jgi:hypothetical protein